MGLTDAFRPLAWLKPFPKSLLKEASRTIALGSPGVNAWAREKCCAELEHLRAHS